MLLKHLLSCGVFAAGVITDPNAHQAPLAESLTSLEFREGEELPFLRLPDATYRAASYNATLDVYRFRNIRFAADAGGENRWREPQPAKVRKEIELNNFPKISCPQVRMSLFKDTPMASEDEEADEIEQEDCLFLDMQIPGTVAHNPSNYSVPVIVFFFGGAYVFGSKDETPDLMYDGARLIGQAGGDLIWISPNYRLGAMGWLAGTTMEQQATPNAGLYDQRFALKWVQDNIAAIGGNKENVTAIGQSAGAGALLHHLVLDGGQIDPYFNQAVLLSPAFIPLYDRKGDLEELFQNFSSKVLETTPCGKKSILECLRAATGPDIIAANAKILADRQKGSFIFGPAADGKLIRQIPALEFATGNYWEGLNSLILSHTSLEGWMFAIDDINTDALFKSFLEELFPPYTHSLIEPMIDFYPAEAYTDPLPQKKRLATFIRDAIVTCNIYWATLAYSQYEEQKGTYNMVYDTVPFLHGSDLMPHFLDNGIKLSNINVTLATNFMKTYKDYFISFYKTGNPNTWNRPGADPRPTWEKAVKAGLDIPFINQVLHARGGSLQDWQFKSYFDIRIPKQACDLWLELQAAMTTLGGYAPPGAEVPSSYDPDPDDPNKNYKTPSTKEKLVVQEL